MIIVDKALRAREEQGKPIRVGMIGAGFMGQGLTNQIVNSVPGMRMSAVYNRRPERPFHVYEYSGCKDVVTAGTQAALDEAIRRSKPVVAEDAFTICRSPEIDVVVDVTGSVEFGAQVILEAFQFGKPVVLMNAEVDATIGPILRTYAKANGVILSACDGDEPGAPDEPVPLGEGTRPHPARDGEREGAAGSLPEPDHPEGLGGAVGSERRDGHLLRRRLQDQLRAVDRRERHRVQGEVARHVAGQGLRWQHRWTSRSSTTSTRFAHSAASWTTRSGLPASRCSAWPSTPIRSSATTSTSTRWARGRSTRSGFPTTWCTSRCRIAIARVVLFGDEVAPPLGGPVVEVCAVAKRDLKAGEVLDEYGMYMTYGEAVNVDEMCANRYLPEGLVEGCRLTRDIPKDPVLTYDDVELPQRAHRRSTPRRAVQALPRRDLARKAPGAGTIEVPRKARRTGMQIYRTDDTASGVQFP